MTKELFIRVHFGGVYKVTAIFTTPEAANVHCETHPDEGVIAEIGAYVFLAAISDGGTAPDTVSGTIVGAPNGKSGHSGFGILSAADVQHVEAFIKETTQ